MAKHGTFPMFAGLLLAATFPAAAQTLIDPAPALRAMGVSQFGVPHDAKFIFCSGEDCSERTIKTMTASQPAPVVAAPRPVLVMLPPQQSIQPPAELSRAKVKSAKKAKKPVMRKKKRLAQLGCGPDTTKK